MICETQCVASKRHAWLPRMAKTPRTHCFFMILTWFIIIFSSYCQNIVTIFSEVGHIDFHNLPSLIYIHTFKFLECIFHISHRSLMFRSDFWARRPPIRGTVHLGKFAFQRINDQPLSWKIHGEWLVNHGDSFLVHHGPQRIVLWWLIHVNNGKIIANHGWMVLQKRFAKRWYHRTYPNSPSEVYNLTIGLTWPMAQSDSGDFLWFFWVQNFRPFFPVLAMLSIY